MRAHKVFFNHNSKLKEFLFVIHPINLREDIQVFDELEDIVLIFDLIAESTLLFDVNAKNKFLAIYTNMEVEIVNPWYLL
jgi:hypothetical protein